MGPLATAWGASLGARVGVDSRCRVAAGGPPEPEFSFLFLFLFLFVFLFLFLGKCALCKARYYSKSAPRRKSEELRILISGLCYSRIIDITQIGKLKDLDLVTLHWQLQLPPVYGVERVCVCVCV